MNFAAGNRRNEFIEKIDQTAQNAGFRLASQSQKDEVVARKNGVDDLGNDRVLVSHDARKDRLLCAETADEVLAKLVLDAASKAFGGVVTAPESAEGRRKWICHGGSIDVRGPS